MVNNRAIANNESDGWRKAGDWQREAANGPNG